MKFKYCLGMNLTCMTGAELSLSDILRKSYFKCLSLSHLTESFQRETSEPEVEGMKILYSACWKEGLNTLIQRFQKLSQGFAGHRESRAVASALPESGACVPAWSGLAPPAPTSSSGASSAGPASPPAQWDASEPAGGTAGGA